MSNMSRASSKRKVGYQAETEFISATPAPAMMKASRLGVKLFRLAAPDAKAARGPSVPR
jgi:hypothetical protein